MRRVLFLALVLICCNAASVAAITFGEAVALLSKKRSSESADVGAELNVLRRSRLPSVRAEVTTNISRTLDLFAEGPYEVRYGTSVLAFDYPLWDGGASALRTAAAAARLRRVTGRGGVDDAAFNELLETYGGLYVAEREVEMLTPLAGESAAEAAANGPLLERGEISNLTAAERDDVALTLESQLFEAAARREELSTRLRILTGAEDASALALDPPPARAEPAPLYDDAVEAATAAVDASRARLRELTAANGTRALLSGFAGFGAAESSFRDLTSSGSFGVYGLRLHLSYPLVRGAEQTAVAEARVELRRAESLREEAIEAARRRFAEYELRQRSATERIELLRRSLDAARRRLETLDRLVTAGLRTTGDVAHARADAIRRELALIHAEVDAWKTAQRIARMGRP